MAGEREKNGSAPPPPPVPGQRIDFGDFEKAARFLRDHSLNKTTEREQAEPPRPEAPERREP